MADKTPEERLAEIRAQRAALADEKSRRDAERSVQDLIEAEELALKNEQAIACAESEHGPVGKLIEVVKTGMGVVIVKRSNPMFYRRFQRSTQTEADIDKFVRPCIVYPDSTRFDVINDCEPHTIIKCANAIAELAGVRSGEVSGK